MTRHRAHGTRVLVIAALAAAVLVGAPLSAQVDGVLAGVVGAMPQTQDGRPDAESGATPQVGADPSAAATSSDFEDAVAAYTAGAYAAARDAFAALAAREPDAGRRAVLHANAGTAAARLDDWGEAVWHLEAAWRARPGDPRVARNLDLVRARLGDPADEVSQFTTTLYRLPLRFTDADVDRIAGGLVAVALLLLAFVRAGKGGRRTAWVAVAVAVAAAGTVAANDLARARDARRAVVVDGTAVRAEPVPDGKVLFRLGPGSVVSDEEVRDGWRLLETRAGGRGWAPVEVVRAAGGGEPAGG